MSEKRPAASPLQDSEKRVCFSDSMNSDEDPEATIITDFPMSSTILEDGEQLEAKTTTFLDAIKRAIMDPSFVDVLTKTISSQVSARLKEDMQQLREEVRELKEEVDVRDKRITELETRLDDQEQYQRRNNIRVTGVPEESGENTDDIILTLTKAIGVKLTLADIDRSHRVGAKDESKQRPILVKFTSYRQKYAVMKARNQLKAKDGQAILPSLNWRSGGGGGQSRGGGAGGGGGKGGSGDSGAGGRREGSIFLNDDLTTARSRVAAAAREKRRNKRLDETWVWDGSIFVKKNDDVKRIHTMEQLNALVP